MCKMKSKIVEDKLLKHAISRYERMKMAETGYMTSDIMTNGVDCYHVRIRLDH